MPVKGVSLPHVTDQEVPTRTQYKQLLVRFATNHRVLAMIRTLSETGMTRQELVNIRKDNFDIELHRLFLPKSKAIRDKRQNGKWTYKERNRYIPINSNLLPILLSYMNSHDSPYIFPPLNRYKNIRPMAPSTVNEIFAHNDIAWSPHKLRHYFRMQVRVWMIKERRVDMQVVKEMMGHKLTVDETYGGQSDFEYKLEILDSVFG